MFSKKTLFVVALFICCHCSLFGQCVLTGNIPIEDDDTTLVSIVVEGLVFDSLSKPDQGLCGINIDFRHEFVGDISMELISPAGQTVRLVGPAVPVSGNTGFTRWNVVFIPCNDLPSPDPGFSSTWNNLQPWGLFGNYTGQYHPYLGCLEDFNMGSANGTWTLRIIDVSQFGSGRIQRVSLFFCNDEGVECQKCQLDPGNLDRLPMEQCQSSSDFVLTDYTESFLIFPKDTSQYVYKWALFNDSTWLQNIFQDSAFSLEVGTYKVCNLQYAPVDENRLPNLPVKLLPATANQYFENSSVCARVGENCVTITIFPTTDTLFRDTFLCSGQNITVNGITIDQEGTYTIELPGMVCDTILVLTVNQKVLQAEITSVSDTISCSNQILTLVGSSGDTTLPDSGFQWFTGDGLIIPTADPKIIEVKSPGIYSLAVTDGVCSDTISKQIFIDESYPQIFLEGLDTITCTNDTVIIKVTSDFALQNITWTSALPFIQHFDTIKIFNPGQYVVEIESENQCFASRSIQVFADIIPPVLELAGDSITCLADTILLEVIAFGTDMFLYKWSGVLTGQESLTTPATDFEGFKTVTVTNLRTGCFATDSVYIRDTRIFPQISIESGSINCERDTFIPMLVVDIPVSSYLWTGNGFFSELPYVVIRQPGLYHVVVKTAEGCSSEAAFNVGIDTVHAQILLSADSLSCAMDSVRIFVDSDKVITTFAWYDSNGDLVSSAPDPYVSVSGVYTLRSIDIDGCLAEQNIEVFGSNDLPNITITAGPISCLSDTVQLLPDKIAGFRFLWEFPDLAISNQPSPMVTLPGKYKVTITDESNESCVEFKEIIVADEREYPVIQVVHGQLTCQNDSVGVQINLNLPVKELDVTGPSFFLEDSIHFFVRLQGMYFITATNDKGCTTRDSFLIFVDDVHPEISVLPFSDITCLQPQVEVSFQSTSPNTNFQVFRDNVLEGAGQNITLMHAGDYIVYGSASNACRDTAYFTILADTIKPDLEVLETDTITCRQPVVFLEAVSLTPAVNISWTGLTGNPASASEGGTYTVRVTSTVNGCFAEKSVDVSENKVFAPYTIYSDRITCKNPLASVEIVTGSAFQTIRWSSGNPEILGEGILNFQTDKQGIYYFEIESTEACLRKDSLIIPVDFSEPGISSINNPELTCTSGEVTLRVNTFLPPDSIIWSFPDGDIVNSLQVTVSKPGRYDLVIFGQNGCRKDTFVQVVQNVKLPVFTAFTDSLSCNKGKGIIGVQTMDNILSYDWRGPDQFSSVVPVNLVTIAGVYTVVVTNDNGCRDSLEIIVKGDYNTPDFSIQDTFLIPCDSSFITLDFVKKDSLTQYHWSLDGVFFSNEQYPMTNRSGIYTLRVTGLNGCPSSKDVVAVQVNLPVGFTYSTDTIKCNRPEIRLTANSPHSDANYTWIAPSGNRFNTAEVLTGEYGFFQLIVEDDNKCLDTVVVEVYADTLKPVIVIEQLGAIICDQRISELRLVDSLRLPFYTYTWFNNGGQILSDPNLPDIRIQDPGLYRLSISNSRNGCTNMQLVPIEEVNSELDEVPLLVRQPTCKDFNFGSAHVNNLQGIPPYELKLNGTRYKNVFDFTLLKPGTYELTIRDSIGCEIDTIFTIDPGIDPKIGLAADTTIFLGDSVLVRLDSAFLADAGFIVRVLDKQDTICNGDCIFPLVLFPGISTFITVQLYTVDGACFIEHRLFVNVKEGIFSGIPNVISKHAENELNRVFYIPQKRGIEQIISMEIFDKWANPVYARYDFLPGDPAFAWDGTRDGKPLESGVYVVVCTFRLTNGKIIKYLGDVTLIY